MGKNDRTVEGRAPSPLGLHEQPTKTLDTRAGKRRRANPLEVAEAVKQFCGSDAAERWRASTAPTRRITKKDK